MVSPFHKTNILVSPSHKTLLYSISHSLIQLEKLQIHSATEYCDACSSRHAQTLCIRNARMRARTSCAHVRARTCVRSRTRPDSSSPDTQTQPTPFKPRQYGLKKCIRGCARTNGPHSYYGNRAKEKHPRRCWTPGICHGQRSCIRPP